LRTKVCFLAADNLGIIVPGDKTMNGIGNQFDFGAFHHHGKKPFNNNVLLDLPKEKNSLEQDQVVKQPNSLVAMKSVFRALSSRFESFNQQPFTEPKESDSNKAEAEQPVFDFNKVSQNVLDFVSARIKNEKSNGASDEKIATLFAQARQGIEQGFNDAQEELTDINKLDGDVAAGITQSRQLIDQGINDLEKQLRPDTAIVQQNTGANTAPSKPNNESSVPQISTAVDYQKQQASSLENTSDLSITTADGDIVTISFSDYAQNSSSQGFNYANTPNGSQASYFESQSSYRETNFSFSVEGNLDEGEKQAIGDLIKGISKIEKSFFDGNIDKAFKQALKLGYDSSEISGFQLDLSQTKTAMVNQTYAEVAKLNDDPNADAIAQAMKPVKDFFAQYQQLGELSKSLFEQQDQPFQQLIDNVFNAQFNQQQDMLTRLHDFIGQLKQEDK